MRTHAPLELDDEVVVLDLADFARAIAPGPELPAPRDLGDGAVVSPRYVQRVADAAARERRARLGARCP